MLTSSLALFGAAILSVVVADPVPAVAATAACTAVASPSGLCGQHGSVINPQEYLTTLVSPLTLKQCVDACEAMGTDHCSSFSSSTNPIDCKYYTNTVGGQFFQKGKTGVKFYDADCYECSCAASLDNGGFDTGHVNPSTTNNLGGSIVSPGYKSKHALSFQLQYQNGETPTTGTLTQPVHLCSGQTYQISYAYYIESSPTSAGCITLYVDQYPMADNFVNQDCPQADGTWHTSTTSYTAGDDNELITFEFTNSDTDNAFYGMIDSITIT